MTIGYAQESLDGVKFELVNNVEKAGEFLTWLGQARPHHLLAVDIETGEYPGNPKADALSPWHGRIRLVQVGDGMTGWSIPWDGWNGVFLEAMNRWDGGIACHNIAFEARWFALQSDFDMPWHRAHDTMLSAHLIDPTASIALKNLSARYIDRKAPALQSLLDTEMANNGWTWGTIPITHEKYWAYGALDTVLTYRLWAQFNELCGPGKPYAAAYELEMATRAVVTKMELGGARIDMEYSQQKYDELHAYGETVKDWCKKHYKTSISSNAQLVRLFEKLGFEITEFTPSGQKSCTKDQLKLIIRDGNAECRQLAELALGQRKADKLAGTYFKNFLERSIDGVVHPSVKTLGARTGRMSITDPALQTLPSGDATVRTAFIPRCEEESIITSDLDQVEFRMTASLSQDPQLIELFNRCDREGGDSFTEILRELYHDPSAQKSDPRRKLVKGVVYGKLYGAGISKMALTANVPDAQMKEVVDAFDARYPGVKKLQSAIEDAGMRRLRAEGEAYVLTGMGRRLPSEDSKVYALTNYAIQGGAAEVFKRDILKLDSAGLTDFLMLPVHDEIVMSVPTCDVPEVREIVKECMTTRDNWAVPLTAGVSDALANWGEAYQ